MPLYEYQCQKCGSVFELIQKFSDEPLTQHESCGGEVVRLVSSPALQFKGSGWYITDYAKGGASGGGSQKDGSGANKDSGSSSTTSNNTSTGGNGSKDSSGSSSSGSSSSPPSKTGK